MRDEIDMKKILIITDSLGVPRLKPEAVLDDQVWTYRLFNDLKYKYSFYLYTVPGLHTNMLVSSLNNQLGAYQPDIVILQIGIVDCAPRALREIERKIIARFPNIIQRLIVEFVQNNYARLVVHRNITYVSLNQFSENLLKLREAFFSTQFIVVPIAPSNLAYEKKNPKIKSSILRYNQALSTVFKDSLMYDIFPKECLDDIFLSDNHHLNCKGHDYIFQTLSRLLS